MPIGKNDFVEKKMVVKFSRAQTSRPGQARRHDEPAEPTSRDANRPHERIWREKRRDYDSTGEAYSELQECREEAGSRTVRCMDYSGENAG